MKKYIVIILLFFFGTFLFGDALSDMIASAKSAYSQGQFSQAVSLLDSAGASYAPDFAAKSRVADALNEIGQTEYSRLNYLNAYECFRRAVKLSPTHQGASDNFWKIKRNFDVADLRNEGTTGTTAAVIPSDSGTTTVSTASTTGTAATSAQSEDIKKYQEELAKQAAMLKQLEAAYNASRVSGAAADPSAAQRDYEIIRNLQQLYENAATQKDTADIELVTAQMQAYQKMFSEQQSGQFTLIFIFIGSFGGLILLLVIGFILFYRLARKRQQQQYTFAADYGIGLEDESRISLEDRQTLLLSDQSDIPDTQGKNRQDKDADMYRDMIRVERLKEMANEKRYGSLKWETVREYMGELTKELRSEILYVVENKINSGEVENLGSIMPVLFPFLTDSDVYLRDKAGSLVEGALGSMSGQKDSHALLELDESRKGKKNDPLSVASLLKHIDKLKGIKPERREHSTNTARYVRGMAAFLDMPEDEQHLLYKTAIVHDIGYSVMDKKTLEALADKKDLTEEDMLFIQKHPEKGVEYFKGVDLPEKMKEGIMYHHERNDGSGYPEGLTRDEIPEFAKIIGVADVFDALTTNRIFRDKMSFDAAAIIMKDLGRNKLEAKYLSALMEYLTRSGKIRR